MQIIIDGQMVRYDVYGTEHSKTILILHGWGDRAAGLAAIATNLAELNYRVFVPDLPGFGESDAPREPWGLSEYAEWVSHYLQKLGIKPDVVMGHSNGGAIAIRALAHGYILTSKLVLLASAGVRSEYKGRKRTLRIIAKSAKALTALLPKKTQRILRKRAYSAIGSDMFVAEHMQETFRRIINDDVRSDARVIIIPVLLVYGDTDTATPVAYGMIFADAMPNATLKIIPGAGHFVHIVAAKEVTHAITEFIS